MRSENINVDIIGFSSKAKGGFRAAADHFNTYLPEFNIDSNLFGHTRGNPAGNGNYIPILTRFSENLYFVFVALFFIAPLLKIRKKSVIMTAYPVNLIPFMLFYPRHPRVYRSAQRLGAIGTNKPWIVSFLYKLLERICIPHANGYAALDEFTKNYLKEHYHIADENIWIIPVGTDLDIFQPIDKGNARDQMGFAHNKEIVLHVSKFTRVKNIELLLRSFEQIAKRRPNTMLALAGTGPLERELKEFVHIRDIPNVQFLGYVDYKDVPTLMNCADVLAIPSSSEVGPRTVGEALACGIPVVTTPVGSVGEFVENGVNGYIVEADISSFTDRLEIVLDNKTSFGEKAFQSRYKLDTRETIGRYAELFRKVYIEAYR